jgi:hypothetical protein
MNRKSRFLNPTWTHQAGCVDSEGGNRSLLRVRRKLQRASGGGGEMEPFLYPGDFKTWANLWEGKKKKLGTFRSLMIDECGGRGLGGGSGSGVNNLDIICYLKKPWQLLEFFCN